MNICIIGAGNIGTYLAAYISLKRRKIKSGYIPLDLQHLMEQLN